MYDFVEFEKERLNERELGKIVLCESREKGTTRLFISRFSIYSDAVTKSGWWDTFTISKKPCEKGFYLCEIQEFRIDSNGFLNAIVMPIKFLNDFTDEEKNSETWNFFFFSRKFSKEYTSRCSLSELNIAALEIVYNEEYFKSEIYEKEMKNNLAFPSFDIRTFAIYLFDKFLKDEVSLKDIEVELKKPPYIEVLAKEIHRAIMRNSKEFDEYPLLKKKFPLDKLFVQDLVDWLQRKVMEYDDLKLGEENEILVRIEAVLSYWENEKELKKALKKQKRLEKKKEGVI